VTAPANTAELKRLAEAATPGPWRCEEGSTSYPECDDRDFWAVVLTPLGRDVVTISERYTAKTDDRKDYDFDAAFIAAANPETVLSLISTIERQAEEIAGLRGIQITMQDVRLRCGEGKLTANDVLNAVNAHLRLSHSKTKEGT
jgi:hypothetical protein